jgi:hypothetical protein
VEKFLANKSFLWIACLGAEATGVLGVASAFSKKDLLGVEAEDWLSLCSLYMMFGGMVLLARLVLIKERGTD